MKTNVGDLRVWWIPQIGYDAIFYVPVKSIEEGCKMMDTLAAYDAFQFDNRIKSDYSNVGGIQMYYDDNGEGEHGWCDWCDQTGEDDPYEYLKDQGIES